jgi:ABC-type transporter Mla MlaB component
MSVVVMHDAEKNKLELVIRGNLDLRSAFWLHGANTYINERLQTCVIDTTQVSRVFDSGIALIMVILKRIQKFQVQLIFVGDIPDLHLPDLGIDNITHLGNSYPKAYKLAPARKPHDHNHAGKSCQCSDSGNCCSGNGHSCGCPPHSTVPSARNTTES